MATAKEKTYYAATGRRKTSIARVRITPGSKLSIMINDQTLEEYFPTEQLRFTASQPLTSLSLPEKFGVTIRVVGGGISSQAEAIRHGLGRAIILYNAELRKPVKEAGFLKRDPRMKERRKFGLKKARKAPQWSKR